MPKWNPEQYLKFQSERTQPAIDLASRIELQEPRRIIDLGCGSGNSTAVLKNRWTDAAISGLDSSPSMIQSATAEYPDLDWIEMDIDAWSPDIGYDLIFSNAAFQWLQTHETLLPKLVSCLNPSGVLAFQVPNNEHSPYHRVLVELAESNRWRGLLEEAKNPLAYYPIDFYYDLLKPTCSQLTLWETEYVHVLEGPEAILEWVSGTGLKPYLEALENQEDRTAFREEVLEGYRAAYPLCYDGSVLFRFRRQFIVAIR